MLEIPLHRESGTALYFQVAEHLRRLVASGALPSGTRLPGTRVLSEELDVSRTTVMQAYALLESDGLIRLEGRSGAFVIGRGVESHTLPENEGILDLASGLPSMDLVPVKAISRSLRDILGLSAETALLGSPPEGLEALRRALVSHAAARGIPASWESLLVTAGLQEGLSTLLKALAVSGTRTLWVEPLTYPDAVLMARSEGLKVRCLPGNPADIPGCVSAMNARDALYLIPSFHNPLGRTIPLALRRAILEETVRREVWVIEDDAYGELRYGEGSVPALKSLPEAGRVLYMGSFSQVLFPGLRFGYLLLSPNLAESAVAVRKIRTGGASSLVQTLVLRLIESGSLSRALDAARLQMSIRMETLAAALSRELPGYSFIRPDGGIYLWLETPGLEGAEAAFRAAARGVRIAPGGGFSVLEEKVEAVRLSISRHGAQSLPMAVCALAAAWSER
ncbi:MAG: PLP-dependent aminotransferase family protein [Synergistales bacterium]